MSEVKMSEVNNVRGKIARGKNVSEVKMSEVKICQR